MRRVTGFILFWMAMGMIVNMLLPNLFVPDLVHLPVYSDRV